MAAEVFALLVTDTRTAFAAWEKRHRRVAAARREEAARSYAETFAPYDDETIDLLLAEDPARFDPDQFDVGDEELARRCAVVQALFEELL